MKEQIKYLVEKSELEEEDAFDLQGKAERFVQQAKTFLEQEGML